MEETDNVERCDVAVVEDVWGPAFEQLATRRAVRRAPEAWADASQLHDTATGAAALVVRNRTQVTRELLHATPSLRVVARAGVGLDNIDLSAADELGVVVVAALGANAASVAEHSLALALAVARHVVPLDAKVRQGTWDRLPGKELSGGTWGLLSAGATARATARLARGLGMRVIAHDPHIDPSLPELRDLGIDLLPLEEVVSAADVLSVHLPSTPQTHHLVDARLLSHMRPDAIVVNVGRGEVVDEEALADALERGHLYGAGLDVREHEPPGESRLHRLPNVVLSPHVAGVTKEAQARIGELLCQDIERVLSGEDARHAVGTHRRPDERVTA
ncbi:NAD(P)-dependent oxidoreductase [Nocardioides sp. LHG3406-4]|uniref:NAD(P)-dependent oxidoreductase n=1 Tax=Nocardioides sp. LHG3406-4 TaxID=2804575 RepID=UPI003CE6D0B0